MGSAEEWWRGKQGVSCFVTVLAAMILLACVFPSQGVTADSQQSETCYGTGNCSLHSLSCPGGSRLAVLEASYGFKLKQLADDCLSAATGDTCPDFCCRYNASSDCKQEFTEDNMLRVQRECSHNSSCQIRAQRGDNTYCSTQQRGITSTLSVLRAVCVPDATTIDPCSNSTVTGSTVSLYLSHPPSSSPCHCTLHKTTNTNTTTTTTATNSSGNIDFYVYEIESSIAGWEVRVEDGEGRPMQEFRGAGRSFPATSASPPESSLPFSVTLSFDNLPDSPRRVWLGFGGESSLALRCGQDAIDYAMSLTTTTTPSTTTPPATTTPEATTTTVATTTTTSASTSTAQTSSSTVPTTFGEEQTPSTGADSRGTSSRALTSEDPQKATNGYNDTLTTDPEGGGLGLTSIVT